MELEVDFEEVHHVVDLMRRRHGALVLLVESLRNVDHLRKRQVVMDVATVHQSLEQLKLTELRQAAAFQLQHEINAFKHRRISQGDTTHRAQGRVQATAQALDAALVMLFEEHRPEGHHGQGTRILEATRFRVELNVGSAQSLADRVEREQIALVQSADKRIQHVEFLFTNHLRCLHGQMREGLRAGESNESLFRKRQTVVGTKVECWQNNLLRSDHHALMRRVFAQRLVVNARVIGDILRGEVNIHFQIFGELIEKIHEILIRPSTGIVASTLLLSIRSSSSIKNVSSLGGGGEQV